MSIQAEFYKSFANISQMEDVKSMPQIAFVGRSNAGKSSLLNMLTNRRGLAITSQKAGRTRLINFFEIKNEYYFVDLPGYGYSSASKGTTQGWGEAIAEYLVNSKHLRLVFILLDIRHDPSQLDVAMLHFLQSHSIPFRILATKCDKLSRAQSHNHRQKLASFLGLGIADIILTSAQNRQGRQDVFDILEQTLV